MAYLQPFQLQFKFHVEGTSYVLGAILLMVGVKLLIFFPAFLFLVFLYNLMPSINTKPKDKIPATPQTQLAACCSSTKNTTAKRIMVATSFQILS